MLEARPNRFMLAWFEWYCRYALRKYFAAVHLYPETPQAWADFDPRLPYLYVANHSSFWDGIVINHLVRRHRLQMLYGMIEEPQVRKHPFFRRVGGFSVDRGNPRDGVRSIQYAIELLRRDPAPALMIFPQGKLLPNDLRPLGFEGGVARIIEGMPRLRVVPIALRYEFRFEQRAEVLVRFGCARSFDGIPRKLIVKELECAVTSSLDYLREAGMRATPPERTLLRGRASIDR
jgi:chlorobactene lauroyltransferase